MVKNLPEKGFGTWQITSEDELLTALKAALSTGYQHIDTAQIYNNETQIGNVLRDLNVERDNLFLTSKVFAPNYKYHVLDSVHESLRRLQVKQLDLMLLHASVSVLDPDLNTKAFKKLLVAREQGLIRYAGVSNFLIPELEAIKNATGEYPYANQIVLSPKTRAIELETFCKAKQIKLIGYSILKAYYNPNAYFPNSGLVPEEKEVIDKLGSKYNKNAGQILSKWALQNGYHIIPKSVNPERIVSNFDLDDFEISTTDLNKINAMNNFTSEEYAALIGKGYVTLKGNAAEVEALFQKGLLFEKNF